MPPAKEKITLENLRTPTELELQVMSEDLSTFYKYRNFREGPFDQLQGYNLEDYLLTSRRLLWNTDITKSEDLRDLNLDFSIPFIRKEVMQFLGRITGQSFKGRFDGDNLDIFGTRVLNAIYEKWRFKNNDKVEKFWEVLYGLTNGTLCKFIGYNNATMTKRYLTSYDTNGGEGKMRTKQMPYWNDVWSEVVPLEDIYLKKIYERNIQKQGDLIWKTDMDWKAFKAEFKNFDNAEYVYPGNQLAEDSLYFKMIEGMGITAGDKIQLIKRYNILDDNFTISANGVWLNPIGKGTKQVRSPIPFTHKQMPFVWSIADPIDEKFAYGLSLPFKIKEGHKILNVGTTMLVEREIRAINPPVLSSDFEAPKLIFGTNAVVPVNDISAYKEMKISEPSSQFFSMMNTMQGYMSDQAQGGGLAAMTPSKQPKSAKEIIALENLKQQTLGVANTMFYNTLYQEMLLVIKTALQFYTVDKYKKVDSRISRLLKIPNTHLTSGGIGNLEVRIVKKKQDDINTFFEAIHKTIVDGKMTEIIEAPINVIQDLEFEINTIDIEPESADKMEKATFFEQVIKPMIEVYVPQGVADLGKVYMRHLEKLGEHPADYSSDKVLPQLMAAWGVDTPYNPNVGKDGQQTTPGAPQQNKPSSPQQNSGQTTGALQQSAIGTKFGSQNAEPLPTGQ